MKNLLKSFTWSQYRRAIEGLLIMLFGLLLVTGGQIGVQVAEKTPSWIPIPKLEPTWVAWVVVWLGFDSIFSNKIGIFLFTKIFYPILKPLLEPLSQLPIIQRIASKLKKYQEKEEEEGEN